MSEVMETEMLVGICMYKTNPERVFRLECPNCNGHNKECPDYDEDKTRRGMIITLSLKEKGVF